MFNSGILDTVIGVIVIFLQLSLVCTAVNEFVALLLKKRAKELEKGILTLLSSKQLADKFYEHPLIKGLRPDQRRPSYIPSRTFALALMDIVRRHSFDGAVTAATQAVADKEKVLSSAQAALDAATVALTDAQKLKTAADTALLGTPADLVAATKAAQDAAKQEAAAQAAKADANTRLTAATTAKTDADNFLIKVTADTKTAKDAEKAAQEAEKAASEKPKDVNLQNAAKAARQIANEAANKLAPSASSLLTEARDKVAGVDSAVVPPELKTALLALMDNAGANLNKAQANLEQWFDDSMDRVSGVYKRKSQVFIFIFAVIITVLSNVDTIQVANNLSHDKAVRDSLVAAAPELAKKVQTSTAQSDGAGGSGAAGGAGGSGAAGGAGGSGAGATTRNAGAAGGNSSASTTPEPSINSIKASLNELNKLGLPIGYVRVCTPLEETVVESCVTETAAAGVEKEAKAKLDTADANAKKAENDLKKAETELKEKGDKFKTSNDAEKAAAQAALAKAQADFDKAKATNDSAAVELTNAQTAHGKATDKVNEIKKLREELKTAEEDAEKNPKDEKKQQAFREARSRVAFAAKCPQCRKMSELTEDELKRRLPTTHDYKLLSADFNDALRALLGDCFNLLYSHWLGWLITALAVSLGAPFWFDTLNRIMVIRSTIKPHEKSGEQESKDNPADDDDKTRKKT